MTSISQNIKFEAEKILESVTKSILLENINDICHLFFSKFSSIFLISKLKQMILSIYQKAIPLIDKVFLESEYRKKNYYKSSSIPIDRTIITIFGELHFKRHYYVDKNKKNGFFFIDQLFHFQEYCTYDEIVRAILIDRSIDDNANKTSMKYNLNLLNLEQYLTQSFIHPIPRQTIYNWIHQWDIPKVEYDYYDNDSKHLYVMVDEKWIHEQIRLSTLTDEEKKKRHYIMSKCFVTFTGAKTKNNRTTLLDKHIFMTTSTDPWKEFMNEIYNIYNYENFDEIYLLSDSGSWILSGSHNLKLFKNNKVILNTCEFHVKEYINRFTRNKEKRKELSKIIYDDRNKRKFIKVADEIIQDSKNKSKKEQYKNYIIKHWRAILNMKDREIKSSMESHISHCVASIFGSRPKGYSQKRIQKYIKLQEYKLNGINIMDLYLSSYNKQSYTYNKEEVSYSLFEHNTSFLPNKSSNNPISIILNKIAYNF